ncbi:MAG: CARDB domain-containing protein [Phycisphaerales bacterium]
MGTGHSTPNPARRATFPLTGRTVRRTDEETEHAPHPTRPCFADVRRPPRRLDFPQCRLPPVCRARPEPLFEQLEERTLLAADIQATLTVPALTGLASAGGTLSGSILLRNTGNAAANGFTYRVFLSTDSVVGNEDDVELTGVDGLTASLASGATSSVNLNTFTIPTDIRPGAYFLIVQLDTTNAVAEGDTGEANNTVRSASPNIVLNGPAAATPNLNASVTFTTRIVGPDEHISVPTTIRNTGAAASGQLHVTWVISTNDIIGDADDIAIDSEVISNIAAGGTVTFNRDVQLPVGVPLGNYRVGVWVDDRADVAESNEGDNRAISAANALVVALPDLTSTLVTSGGSIAPGSYFTGTLTVRNLTQAASGSFYVTISLSSDGIAGNDDDIELMSVRVTDLSNPAMGLAGNATRVFSNLRMYIPYGATGGGALNPGSYRVVVTVDSDEEVTESSESNNQTISTTASVTIPARNTANDPAGPDLTTYVYPISGTYQPGQAITVSAIIANLGNATAASPIFSAYLSANNTLDGGDVLLSGDVFGDLGDTGPGSLFATANLTIPGSAPNGTFYVILVADVDDDIEETNENNNASAAGTATVSRPVLSITAPDAAAAEVTTGTANGGQFRIARTGPTTSELVVHYTVAGTAGEGDFNSEAFTGTVTIPAGQAFVLLNLSAVNDALAETDETVIITLSNDPFYTVSGTQSNATVTIADNEPRISITTVRATGTEGGTATTAQGQFRVTRTGSTAAALTVTFTLTGTADDGVDFNVSGTGVTYDATTHTGTVIIPIGQLSATFNIDVIDDQVGEDPETVIATPVADEDLYSVSATAGSATVTINDNEALVTVTAPDAAAAETTGAANGGQYRITRTGATTGALVVHFGMQGTASALNDYVLSSTVTGANLTFDTGTGFGTVTIPAGASFVTVNLAVTDDSTGEDPETAIFRLDNDDAYRLGTTAQRLGHCHHRRQRADGHPPGVRRRCRGAPGHRPGQPRPVPRHPACDQHRRRPGGALHHERHRRTLGRLHPHRRRGRHGDVQLRHRRRHRDHPQRPDHRGGQPRCDQRRDRRTQRDGDHDAAERRGLPRVDRRLSAHRHRHHRRQRADRVAHRHRPHRHRRPGQWRQRLRQLPHLPYRRPGPGTAHQRHRHGHGCQRRLDQLHHH